MDFSGSFFKPPSNEGLAAELAKLDPDFQKYIQLMRDKLAKPEGKRFQPNLESVRAALVEQLGFKLTPAKRSASVLVVKPANEVQAATNTN